MTKAPGPVHGDSLAGRTVRWRFDDGPTAGTVYEHTFRSDGTVSWRAVGAKTKGAGRTGEPKEASAPKYASFQIGPQTHLVSYLAQSGYTLTVAVNLRTKKCWGVASNEKEWYPVTGELEPVPPN